MSDDNDTTQTPQTSVDIGGIEIPIVNINWSDWQTCDDVPAPHWHTYDGDGNSVCNGEKAG